MYFCIFKIQNTCILFKYIFQASIFVFYLNTFHDQVFVFCIKILYDVFVPSSEDAKQSDATS